MFGFFNRPPKKFIAHHLDPMRGYFTDEVIPDSEDDAKRLAQIADGDKLYFLTHYEDGKPVETIVHASQKQHWMNLKNEHY